MQNEWRYESKDNDKLKNINASMRSKQSISMHIKQMLIASQVNKIQPRSKRNNFFIRLTVKYAHNKIPAANSKLRTNGNSDRIIEEENKKPCCRRPNNQWL